MSIGSWGFCSPWSENPGFPLTRSVALTNSDLTTVMHCVEIYFSMSCQILKQFFTFAETTVRYKRRIGVLLDHRLLSYTIVTHNLPVLILQRPRPSPVASMPARFANTRKNGQDWRLVSFSRCKCQNSSVRRERLSVVDNIKLIPFIYF